MFVGAIHESPVNNTDNTDNTDNTTVTADSEHADTANTANAGFVYRKCAVPFCLLN